MSNHHTIALTAIALVIWAISREWSLLKRWKLALACVIACAVGLLPYVYLPIRANSDPAINWGDPSTPQRFWQHVTRAQYGAIGPMKTREPRSLARLGAQFGYLAGALADDMTPWLAICGTVALGWLWKARRHLFWLSLLWLLNTGLLFALLANYDLDRTSRWAMRVFLIPTSLGLIIPLTLLLDQLRALIGARSAGHPLVGFTASALLVVAAPASVLAANWRQCDYSNYWYAYDHAQNLLRCMLPGAIIFPSGDHSTFPLVYLTKVEGQRPDVLIADIYGYTDPELYRDRPEDSPESPESWLIKTARRPVYYVTKSASPVENASFVPAGMLYHLLPHDMPFDSAGLLQRCSYRNLRVPTVADFGATQILVDYAFFRGVDALRAHDEEAALQHFAHAARLGYGIKEVFNNIGSALGEHGLIEPSITYFRGAAALDKYYKMPRWNLYRSYKQTGRLHEAEQVLREILAADPDDARARTESTRTRPEPR